MCRPRWWMRLLRRVHTTSIDWLHWQWGITVEATVILNSRLMMWMVAAMLLPSSIVVFKVILVVLLVVHLQLAHSGWRKTAWGPIFGRVWRQVSVLNAKSRTGVCTCSVVLVYRGGVGDLRPAKCMHARDKILVPEAKQHQGGCTVVWG